MSEIYKTLEANLGAPKTELFWVFLRDVFAWDIYKLTEIIGAFKQEVSRAYKNNKTSHMKRHFPQMQYWLYNQYIWFPEYYGLVLSLKQKKNYVLLEALSSQEIFEGGEGSDETLYEKITFIYGKKILKRYRSHIAHGAQEGVIIDTGVLMDYLDLLQDQYGITIPSIHRDLFLRNYKAYSDEFFKKHDLKMDTYTYLSH